MDPRPNLSLDKSKKPSRMLALGALLVSFSLPFILVKTFPHKPKISEVPVSQTNPEHYIQEKEIRETETSDKRLLLDAKKKIDKKVSLATTKPSTLIAPKKVITANVSTDAKTNDTGDWTIIKIRDKDSLATIFSRVGLGAQTLNKILHDNPQAKMLTRLRPNQEIQFLIKQHVLQKMIVPSNTQTIEVTLEGTRYRTKINTRKMNSRNQFITATIQGSLYGTAKRYNIPSKLMQQMTEIFTWDIDFAKDVRAGDNFTIVYNANYVDNKLVNTGDILAVSYNNRVKTFQAVRFTDRTGNTEYYTPQGISLKKAFTRYPIRFSHISSSFSLGRYHPILHYMRAHKGVDLAAQIGTPIMSTGSGRIEMIGRQNGYGNMIKIKHDVKYSSIYGHMLKFQKGLSKGDYVKRGQVIGYVGQSGLASGPHCHYEFHINGQPKNPTTVDLPRGLAIPQREMLAFKNTSNALLAQLKQHEHASKLG